MQLDGDVWEIAINIPLELHRNRNEIAGASFALTTKVALENAPKLASKIAYVNGP